MGFEDDVRAERYRAQVRAKAREDEQWAGAGAGCLGCIGLSIILALFAWDWHVATVLLGAALFVAMKR